MSSLECILPDLSAHLDIYCSRHLAIFVFFHTVRVTILLCCSHFHGIKNKSWEFPGGPVVKILWSRASLVVQWLRIRLPMQGTRVRALVPEDPTCRGAAGPVSHSC